MEGRLLMIRKSFFLPNKSCPHRCIYCDQHAITGEIQEPDRCQILSEVSRVGKNRSVEICYFGGSFTCLPLDIQKQYLDTVLETGPDNSVRFSTHPTCFGNEVLSLLKNYPVSMIELGVSSLDNEVLEQCRRGYAASDVITVIQALLKLKYNVGAQLMIGLPHQTEESTFSDLETLASISGDSSLTLRIYPCLVLKNTQLEKLLLKGEYTPLSIENAVRWSGKVHRRAIDLGFKIQRIGLHETPSLNNSVIAGPHHPSLGEMARAFSLILDITGNDPSGPWKIPRRNISMLQGHNNFGIRSLADISGFSVQEIKAKISYI